MRHLAKSESHYLVHGADGGALMMMKVGTEVIRKYDLRNLRFFASVGEPLNPEAVVWGQEAFGLPIHDNWWQTETGGIMIANYAAMDIRPGSMGARKFLDAIDQAVPQQFAIHLIIDNYSTHKSALIRNWLAKRPRYHVHFTPTRGSWLNQIERWFAT